MSATAAPSINAIRNALQNCQASPELGVIEQVVGLIIESVGPKATLGDLCHIYTPDRQEVIRAEVIGFRQGRLLLMPLESIENRIAPGCWVENTGGGFKITVGPGLLGRVLNGYGEPIDYRSGKPTQISGKKQSTWAECPHPLERKPIETPIELGIRAMDGFLTMGFGQRMGIFAGSGVGKSTTMGMLARNSNCDLNVIALVGERGREVQEFIEESLGPEGLQKSVVIVSTGEQPAMAKIKAALVATSIAEYFRDSGKNVLLMMDSVTRVAMALREIGLAAGEPPTTRGYTPSVFAFLPKLLERSGTNDKGSITGLYTVLVEGDDMNEPVADTVRGILDGHMVLSRRLAEANHYPAIDVLASVSRLQTHMASTEHRKAASLLRDLLSTYNRSEDLIGIGAYVPGANAKLDRAIHLKDELDLFLRQDIHEITPFGTMLDRLLQLAG